MTLICEDQGEPRLTSRRVIDIDVVDVNDHTPRLSNELIEVSIVENNPPKTVVTRINASDADEGRNKALHYRLVPMDVSSSGTSLVGGLVVDPITGVVTTDRTFDYEIVPRDFRFLLIVSDRGDEPRTATATLHLAVVDTNDVRPRFDRSRYECVVSENATVGSSVCRIVATDDDVTPAFRRIRYAIEESMTNDGNGNAYFRLDTYSGVLKTTRRLDREMQSEYRFTVYASDLGHHPDDGGDVSSDEGGRSHSKLTTMTTTSHSTTKGDRPAVAELHVVVVDENDNRPVFSFPSSASGGQVTVEVRPSRRTHRVAGGEGSSGTEDRAPAAAAVVGSGMLVARLVATDADEGPNAELTYSIAHGNEERVFNVDPTTGVITVSSTGPGLDVDRHVYRLIVSVTDNGSPRLAAVADLDVLVVVSTASELSSSSEGGSQSFLDANTVILLAGLILGVVLVATAIIVAVVCVRRHGLRKRQRYLAVKRSDNAPPTGSAIAVAIDGCGGESEPSLGNHCSDLGCRSDHTSRCQFGYQDADCCSFRCHGNGGDVNEPTTMTTTYSSVRPHVTLCRDGNVDMQNSVTTCSDLHDIDDEMVYYDELNELGPLHRGCPQCCSGGAGLQRNAMETGGCCRGDMVSSLRNLRVLFTIIIVFGLFDTRLSNGGYLITVIADILRDHIDGLLLLFIARYKKATSINKC